MLRSWTKILPFFLIEWYTKKNLNSYRINIAGWNWEEGTVRKAVNPYDGVFILTESQYSRKKVE